MQLHHTDYDKHLDFLENHEGSVLFFEQKTNPRRFVNRVVNAVKHLPPGHQCLVLFKQDARDDKAAHHVMRRIGLQLEDEAMETLVHAFVLPAALFSIVKNEQDLQDFLDLQEAGL